MANHNQNREQYLANALSRQQPWLAEGISRRTWERRRLKGTVASPVASPISTGVASPAVVASPVASPAIHGAAACVNDAASPLAEKLKLLRSLDVTLAAQGQTTLTKRTDISGLPEPYNGMRLNTLVQSLRRARDSVPPEYDRWLSDIRLWGTGHGELKSQPTAPREFLDDLIVIAGQHRFPVLTEVFDHYEHRRWCWPAQKIERIKGIREEMKRDRYWRPRLHEWRSARSDPVATAILALMKTNPKRLWTLSALAKRLKKSRQTIYLVTIDMRLRSEIDLIDAARGLYGLPKCGKEIKKSGSVRMIEILLTEPDHAMRYVTLERAVGSLIAGSLFRLRKKRVMDPGDPSKQSPIKLSKDALAKHRAGWTAKALARADLRHQ
jgi:hypothetical protein